MKHDPLKEDWIHIIKKDMNDINLNMSDEDHMKIPTDKFRQLIKEKVRVLAFADLEKIKNGHTKV